MRYILALILILNLIGLSGCTEKSAPDVPDNAPSMMVETPVEVVEEEEPVDIGSMEASIQVECLIAASDTTPNMVVESITDKRQSLNLFTAKVAQPAPANVWLSTQIHSTEAMTERPVVYQGTFIRKIHKGEAKAIGSFSGVLHRGNTNKNSDAWKANPPGTRIDILEGVTVEAGTKVQVYAQVNLLLLPADTDIEAVDTDTVTVDSIDEGVKHSNPIQITFD